MIDKSDFSVYFHSDINKWIVDKYSQDNQLHPTEAPYWDKCGEFQTESAAQEWIELELNQRGGS